MAVTPTEGTANVPTSPTAAVPAAFVPILLPRTVAVEPYTETEYRVW